MPDPFTVEQSYRTLKHTLALLSTPRMRLLQTVEFVEPLLREGGQPFLAAYASEVATKLAADIHRTNFEYTNPAFLDRIIRAAEGLAGLLPTESEQAELKRCVAEVQKARESLASCSTSRRRGNGEEVADEAKGRRPASLMNGAASSFVDRVWIPMVDQEPLLPEMEPRFASLRQMRIEVHVSKKAGQEDRIVVDQIVDPDGHQHEQIRAALDAAKNLFERLTHTKLKNRFIVHCSFDRPNVVLGDSLGAGLAAVILAEMIRLHQFRREFALRNDIAITGKIDSNGGLVHLDEQALRLKTEASLFSPVRWLVVPKGDELFCEGIVKDITANHQEAAPIRIIGIGSMEEIFYDRRLTDADRVSTLKQSARKIWKYRRAVAAVVFVGLLGLIGKMWYGPVDKNPVSAKAEGDMLRIENKYGDRIGQILVRNPKHAPTSFYDVDGDGINEVIYGHKDDGQRENVSYVRCRSITRDSILWEYKLNQDTALPTEYNTTERNFFCRELWAGDLGKDLAGRVIGTAVSGYSPCFVFMLNVKDGSELGKYFHYGHLSGPAMVDLERDGISEAVFAGVNDRINDASIVVLDPRLISGVCTLGSEAGKGSYSGRERFYVRIPRTIVGEVYKRKHLTRYSQAAIEQVRESERAIRFRVTDVHPNLTQDNGTIYPHFGFDMRVIEVHRGDDYWNLARKLLERAEISRFPDEEYFREYQKTFEYWDGEKWTRRVTMNGKYLEALKELQ